MNPYTDMKPRLYPFIGVEKPHSQDQIRSLTEAKAVETLAPEAGTQLGAALDEF